MSDNYLTNYLIIATPGMSDPAFSGAVAYICEHTSEGAMGIVLNRPFDELSLGDIFDQMHIFSTNLDIVQQKVFVGGPVAGEQGFVLHDPSHQWKSTFVSSDSKIALTTSRDVLKDLAAGKGPAKSLVSLGYAGWSAGQLEEEIKLNHWLATPATPDILFDIPYENRWQAAVDSIGIDIERLSTEVGRA